MKHINESYAKYFVKKYLKEQSGHVFGQRYQRQLVQNKTYSKTLFVYIMFNSYKHNKNIKPSQWPYTSYRAISGEIKLPDFLSTDLFKSSFIDINDFYKFSTKFDYAWNPAKEAIAQFFLGDEDFAQNIINRYVDIENENLNSIVKMRNYMGPNRIMSYISQLDLSNRDKTDSIIYLLREFTDLTRNDVGTLLGVSKDVITQRHRKTQQQIECNPKWSNILSLEALILSSLSVDV